MIDRIEELEKEVKTILYAYEQNMLFLESNNESISMAIEYMKGMPESMKLLHDRLTVLEKAVISLQNNK